MASYVFLLVFFFQAEDGIRDLTVTGVQTCALPIFALGILGLFIFNWDRKVRTSKALWISVIWMILAASASKWLQSGPRSAVDQFRSEERRVGKECRSRWSPYH